MVRPVWCRPVIYQWSASLCLHSCFRRVLSMPRVRLLIATTNQGKIREYREILDHLPADLVTPTELGLSLEVEETGATFRENSALKARAFHEASGLVTFSEDSGLEIDPLDGAPGVYSARWGGTSDYSIKNQ